MAVTLIFIISLLFPTDRAVSVTDYIQNIALIRLFHKIQLVDGAHWYIFALLQLQLLGTLFLYACRRKKILLFIIPLAYLVYLRFYGQSVFTASHVIAFAAGVVLNLNEDYPKQGRMLLCYGVATLLLAYVLKSYLLVLLLVAFYLLVRNQSVLQASFSNKMLVFIGTYSYMWYLLHQNIGFMQLAYLNREGYVGTIYILIPIASTLFMAWCCQKFVLPQVTKLLSKL